MLETIVALFTSLITLFTPLAGTTTSVLQDKTAGTKIDNYPYVVYVTQVKEDMDNTLILNYSKKISSEAIISANSCKLAINGGFYDTDYLPLGFVKVGTKTISKERDSKLFNGYVWKDKKGGLSFGSSKPDEDTEYIFQTGPYLKIGSNYSFDGTKNARRMLLAKNATQDIYLVAVLGEENGFNGPTLAELSDILFSALDEYSFVEAVNLDGGSASTFYGLDLHIAEFSPIGALLCIK